MLWFYVEAARRPPPATRRPPPAARNGVNAITQNHWMDCSQIWYTHW